MNGTEKKVQTSVRALVEFILRSGDLDNRRGGWADQEAMLAGSRIHRKIQQRRGAGYTPEVPLKYERQYADYTLVIEGRADGICRTGAGRAEQMWLEENACPENRTRAAAESLSEIVLIEEIKGVYTELERIEEPVPVHLAQAMCYAYIYGIQNGLQEVFISMTYVNMDTELEKKFVRSYEIGELSEWFEKLLEAFHRWTGSQLEWEKKRDASMQSLEFPFAYRPGQRDMVVDVYRTIIRGRQLFVQAPTGIGKTMSAVFPSVRAIGEGFGEKLFYLTAKTVTRTVAEEAFRTLRQKGLCFRSLTVTSKEKTCILDEPDCNPASCPRAKGHFDRVNQAVWDLLQNGSGSGFGREEILHQAENWNVCPFEMQLDLAYFVDGIICDYNYVFDPDARLRRFFGETGRRGDWIFLIDEAHNLVERGRDMYSADLIREDLLDAAVLAGEELEYAEELLHPSASSAGRRKKRKKGETAVSGPVQERLPFFEEESAGPPAPGRKEKKRLEGLQKNLLKLIKASKHCAGILLEYRREQEALQATGVGDAGRGGLPDNGKIMERNSIEEFSAALLNMGAALSGVLSDMREGDRRRSLLNMYFRVGSFLNMYDLLDENYIIYTEINGEDCFRVKLFCVNPARNLQSCLDKGRSAVFYSATLLPVKYYQSLLSAREDDYAVYIRSPFDNSRRLLLIGRDVSSRYTRRTKDEYSRFAAYILEMAAAREGRYLAFFPSYHMLEEVYGAFLELSAGYSEGREEIRCLCQTPSMPEKDRETFLEAFRERNTEGTLVGFCVMGGIFSEGIDLYGDSLIGAVVAGTGLPQISAERELLKKYYDRNGKNGFDYAYRFPGMNKVQQAAGRVIRTTEDRGVILLLDERFAFRENRQLFPVEWADAGTCTLNNAGSQMRSFWQSAGEHPHHTSEETGQKALPEEKE